MLKFADKALLRNNKVVMTYRGTDSAGRDFFAYILCNENGVSLLRKDFAEKTSRPIAEYGEIIYSAYLKDPDAKAQKFLEDYTTVNGGNLI